MQETASAQAISSYASSRLINYKGTNKDGLRQKMDAFTMLHQPDSKPARMGM